MTACYIFLFSVRCFHGLNLSEKLSPKTRQWVEDLGCKHSTVHNYFRHLSDFQSFTEEKLGMNIDSTMEGLLTKRIDSFLILDDFASWLVHNKIKKNIIGFGVAGNRLRLVRKFLQDSGIEVQNMSRKYVATIPRSPREEKTVPDIVLLSRLVQAMPIGLRTYCVFLAALGWRPVEILWLSSEDIDETKDPPVVQIIGKKAKMLGRKRLMYLSNEAYHQYKGWMRFKHRPRRISRPNKEGGYEEVFLKPIIRESDLIFAPYREKQQTYTEHYVDILYRYYQGPFKRTLEAFGYVQSPQRKHLSITLRTIPLSIYSILRNHAPYEFAEYYRGRLNSTYWGKTESVKKAMFKEAEPYLSILKPVVK